jgi:hypothetical protein
MATFQEYLSPENKLIAIEDDPDTETSNGELTKGKRAPGNRKPSSTAFDVSHKMETYVSDEDKTNNQQSSATSIKNNTEQRRKTIGFTRQLFMDHARQRQQLRTQSCPRPL